VNPERDECRGPWAVAFGGGEEPVEFGGVEPMVGESSPTRGRRT
jgi:hypothetical protein